MTATFQIRYTPLAYQDLVAIYHYIADELLVPETAAAQIKRIQDQIKKLTILPERFKEVEWEPWKSMGFHEFAVDRYIVFYQILQEESEILIVRIVYGGRNLKDLAEEI